MQATEQISGVWILLSAFGIFFMQCGFSMLEAGSVRAKNCRSVLMKNLVDVVLAVLVWWLWGFGFYNGSGDFIGGKECMSTNDVNQFIAWLQSFCFATTTATIISGGEWVIWVSRGTGFADVVIFHLCRAHQPGHQPCLSASASRSTCGSPSSR